LPLKWARAGRVNIASAASASERSVDGPEHARIIAGRSDMGRVNWCADDTADTVTKAHVHSVNVQ